MLPAVNHPRCLLAFLFAAALLFTSNQGSRIMSDELSKGLPESATPSALLQSVREIENSVAEASIDFSQFGKGRTDPLAIARYLSKVSKDALDLYANRIYSTAFMNDNLVAFTTLINFGLDPNQVDPEMPISVFDLLCCSSDISPNQGKMRDLLKERFGGPSSRQMDICKDFDASKLTFLPRYANYETIAERFKSTLQDMKDRKVHLHDGSTILHQAVIGNNIELVRRLLNEGWKAHPHWRESSGPILGAKPDGTLFGLIPQLKIPLAFAIKLNHLEIANVLFDQEGTSWSTLLRTTKHNLRHNAHSLPLNVRFSILDRLTGDFDEPDCKHTSIKEAVRNFSDDDNSSICLDYLFWGKGTRTEIDLEFLTLAIQYLKEENLKNALAETTRLLVGPSAEPLPRIHQAIWTGLKSNVETESAALKRKIALLDEFNFKLDDPTNFVDNLSPWREVLECPGISVHLITAMASCSNLLNVNKLTNFPDAPIVHALKKGNAHVVKALVGVHKEVGLILEGNFDVDYKETIMHLAIIHLSDGPELLDIVTHLGKDYPSLLNKESFVSSVNTITYKKEDKSITYSLDKRSGWTPVIYAVFLRKNVIARHLVNVLNVDMTTIKGSDRLDINQVIKVRCDAYKAHSGIHKSSPAVVQASIPQAKDASTAVAVNSAHIKRFVEMATKYINDRINYSP